MIAKRLMIVDDEPDMVSMLAAHFSGDGYDVSKACTGAEALEVARARHPNIVLLDYRIPVLDGLDTMSKLKTVIPEAMVIVITGMGSEEVAVEFMKRGAKDYVRKPFDLEKLSRLVRRCLDEYFDTIVRRNSEYAYPLDDEVIHRYEFLRAIYSAPHPDITKISARFGYGRHVFYRLDEQMRRYGVYGLFDASPEELSRSLRRGERLVPREEIPRPEEPGPARRRYPFSRFINPNDAVQARLEMMREAATSKHPHIGKICAKYGISRQLFYTLYDRFSKQGALGLVNRLRGRIRKSDTRPGQA